MNIHESPRTAMLVGTAVADAASMGLHWIYAQPRVRRAGGDTPEFTEPDPANYEGVPSYFAHAGRHAGDFSMYGESLMVVLRSIAENGAFDWQHYAQKFQGHFGFGGGYVGYIDTPTRETLVNMIIQQRELLDAAMAVEFDGSDDTKRSIARKVISNAQLVRGEALRNKVTESIRLTKGDEADVELAERMIEILDGKVSYPGADDAQLPALTKVPVLVAAYHDNPRLEQLVEEAVRVTNNNDEAVDWALFVTRLLRWAVRDGSSIGDLEAQVKKVLETSPPHVATAVEGVLKRRGEDPKTVTMKIGPACELKTGVPVALHNLLTADSYTTAVRRNILACGDSCGRAMVVGSLAGALFARDEAAGVPADWIARVTQGEELTALTEEIVP
ncbi:MAG: ADP-ribosylglycohydrolase family protein [Alkalispirochaeta sp.]